MSALTDRIAAEHRIYQTGGGTLRCRARGCRWEGAPTDTACATHIAAVTEAAVREQIAREINALAVIAHDDLRADRRRTRAESYDGGTALAYETAARIARGDS